MGREATAAVILLTLGLLVDALGGPARAAAQPRGFSHRLDADDRRRLDHGRLIPRPATERRGALRLIGGTSYQVVDLPPEAVWAAVSDDDTTQLRHMLPEVESATELRRNGPLRVIRFTHEVGMVSAAYALRFQYDDSQKVVLFQLDESEPHNGIRAAWGFIRLRRWHDGRTLVSFGSMVDVGSGLVAGFMRPTLHEWILKIPWTIKKHLEGEGRARYAASSAR